MWRMQDAMDDASCTLASLFPSFSSMILPRDLSAEGQGPRLSSALARALKAGRPHRGPRSLAHALRLGAAVRSLSAASACSLPPARRYFASCACFPFERRRAVLPSVPTPKRPPFKASGLAIQAQYIQTTRNLCSFSLILLL